MPEPFDSASPPPQSPPPIRPTLEINSDDCMWAMMAHLAMFVFAIFGPLIIYLVKKEESSIRSSRRSRPTRASRIGIRIRFGWWISTEADSSRIKARPPLRDSI